MNFEQIPAEDAKKACAENGRSWSRIDLYHDKGYKIVRPTNSSSFIELHHEITNGIINNEDFCVKGIENEVLVGDACLLPNTSAACLGREPCLR